MNNTTTLRQRIQSIDILRGIVMVIMALDHTRDFFYKADVQAAASVATDPTNMATTTPALFFTRWITHFCAPIFLFLSGISARLMRQKKTTAQLSAFLIKRGLWLVVVECVIITLGWTFNPMFNVIILQVIWAIGISMIVMGLVVYLPFSVILTFALVLIAGLNIFDYPSLSAGLKGNVWADFLYFGQFKVYSLDATHIVLLVYAFLPWTAVMMLGYSFGKLYENGFDTAKRRSILMRSGVIFLIVFVALRFINVYGDPLPWAHQPRGAVFTLLSFLNVNKYPPSLLFISMTVGVGLILLAQLEKWQNRFTGIMNIYGRVPMFYYILHFYLIHIIVVIVFYASGFTSKDIVPPNVPFFFRPPTFGLPLSGVYVVWLIVVIVLYPLCKKYNHYKSTHRKWWLQYT